MTAKSLVWTVTALVAAAAGIPASAATVVENGTIRFVVGEPQGAHAELLIKPRFNSRHVIAVRLMGAGGPGGRLHINVDGSPAPVFSTVLTAAHCPARQGRTNCEVVVPGHGPQAAAIVEAFKSGQVVHVDVMAGETAMMKASGSLDGFMAAFRQAAR